MKLTSVRDIPGRLTKGRVYDGQLVAQGREHGFVCFCDERQWVLFPEDFFVPMGQYAIEGIPRPEYDFGVNKCVHCGKIIDATIAIQHLKECIAEYVDVIPTACSHGKSLRDRCFECDPNTGVENRK